MAALHGFAAVAEHEKHLTVHNARKLLDASDLLAPWPLSAGFARALLTAPKHETLAQWLDRVEASPEHPAAGRELADELRRRIAISAVSPRPLGEGQGVRASRVELNNRGDLLAGSPHPNPLPEGEGTENYTLPKGEGTENSPLPKGEETLTFHRTATRQFETAYWRTIARLAHGRYVNKDNADCVRDAASQSLLTHHRRDLKALGDYLLGYYRRLFEKAGMSGRATAGDLPFRWQTDFAYPWSGGWLGNREGREEERDLLVMIPGRDRRRAVIMADHYDTAYMEDRYEKSRGGNGARLAAAGADDNHSATAALMLGAPVFLELSRAGRLACDVWLVHLTGEEFPSDCMGARHLARSIVEGELSVRLASGQRRDLSKTRIEGVYVSDMIAHNNDRDRDVFQISPGAGRDSLRLACHAHAANAAWNVCAPAWNRRAGRRAGQASGPSHRSIDGATIPPTAPHPLLHGEVRTPDDPRSSLYNTDGQIFSDAGVPVVLFMENYDINRVGYHDTQDTMANIDLDYGSAVAAIAIESVARAAAVHGAENRVSGTRRVPSAN